MKERPILFSAEMVKAILDGRKTQTRRALKHQPLDIIPMKSGVEWVTLEQREPEPKGKVARCRFGASGDRLWVKETWRPLMDHLSECTGPKDIRYAASVSEAEWATSKWRPSIFMPRWASRITLEITDVRVQLLRTISEADAKAEGVIHDGSYRNYRDHFFDLWKRINGSASFEANPWVWAITFRRV